MDFPGGASGKEPACQCIRLFILLYFAFPCHHHIIFLINLLILVGD